MLRLDSRLKFSLRTLFVLVTLAALSTPAIPPLVTWLFPPEPEPSPTAFSSNLILQLGQGQSVVDEELVDFQAIIRYTGPGDPDASLAEIAKRICTERWYVALSELKQGANQSLDEAKVSFVRAQFLNDIDDDGARDNFDPANWSFGIEPDESKPVGAEQSGTGFF